MYNVVCDLIIVFVRFLFLFLNVDLAAAARGLVICMVLGAWGLGWGSG